MHFVRSNNISKHLIFLQNTIIVVGAHTSQSLIISGKENSRLNVIRSQRKQKYILLESWLSK